MYFTLVRSLAGGETQKGYKNCILCKDFAMVRVVNRSIWILVLILSGCASPSNRSGANLAAQSKEEDQVYRLLLAEIAGQRGQLDVSVKNLLHVAEQISDPAIAERAAWAAVYNKDLTTARVAVKRWLALAPENAHALRFAAMLAVRQGDVDTADRHFQKLLLVDEDGKGLKQGFQAIAGLLRREGKQYGQTSLVVMERLVDAHKDFSFAHVAYAELALYMGKTDLAEAALERSLILQPGYDLAIIMKARLLRHRGRVEQALAELATAVGNDTGNKKLRLAYARLLLDAKRYPDAKTQFKYLLSKTPEDTDYIYTLALLTLDMNQVEEAKLYLQQLLDLGVREAAANYYLGRVEEVLLNYPAAIAHYTKAVQSEYELDAQIRIGQLKAQTGNLEDGLSYLKGLRDQHTKASVSVRLYLAEAELLRNVKRYGDAIEVLTAGLKAVPGNTDLLYSRSLLYERIGRIDLSETDLRAVLLREPENASALNALGYTLADQTNRYQEAYELIQQALKLEPEDPAIIDSMGWVLYRLGRMEEAVAYLRRALSIQFDNEIAAHLGEILWVMGHERAARSLVEDALEKSPDNEHLLNVKKQIEKLNRIPLQ